MAGASRPRPLPSKQTDICHHVLPSPTMAKRSEPRKPRSGWTIREMTFAEAEAEDAQRYLAMTPAERVRLVPELFAACLSTRGIVEPPRLRRVYSYPE
jgi:hypothetical protein